jgi:hypothetical protein
MDIFFEGGAAAPAPALTGKTCVILVILLKLNLLLIDKSLHINIGADHDNLEASFVLNKHVVKF